MKTAAIPSVRVEPELRAEIEALLGQGETVSEFVETSVRAAVMRRRHQSEFIARGQRAMDAARQANDFVSTEAVVQGLQRKLEAARSRRSSKRK